MRLLYDQSVITMRFISHAYAIPLQYPCNTDSNPSLFPSSSRVTFFHGIIFITWVFWVFWVFLLYPFYPKYPNYYHISSTIQYILTPCNSSLITYSSQFITISHGLPADKFWSITKSPQNTISKSFLPENQWVYSQNIE